MSISDILFESRHQFRLRTFRKKVEPEEDEWCEFCGHSCEFCTCPDGLKFEEEPEKI